MILLEGCDRCGKTTVALKLRELLGRWSYRSHTKPSGSVLAYQLQTFADSTTRVILDRCHYSNVVYGQLFKNQDILTNRDWQFMELALQALQCTVLWLDDEDSAIKGRWSASEMYQKESAVAIARAYRYYFETGKPHETALTVFQLRLPQLIDQQTGRETDLLRQFQRLEHTKESRAERMSLLPPTCGIGNVQDGGFMIVGEAPSDAQYEGYYAPRLPFDMGPASEWLWQSLLSRGIDIHRGYYTNASAYDTVRDMAQLITHMRPRVVVGLGKVAERLLVATSNYALCGGDARFAYVRHPMAARRFEFTQFDKYADELTEPLAAFRRQS